MPDRITLTAHPVRVPLVRPFVTAVRTATELETVLVEASDGRGNSGWGEAPISRVTRATTPGVLDDVNGRLARAVHASESPVDAAAAVSRSAAGAAARMAVDCALLDLAAQQEGVTLARFLGGEQGAVTTDMTLSVGTPDALAIAAAEQVAAGFTCIKVKLDAAGDQLERMSAVRAAVGPHVRLRVDANQAFAASDAVSIIRSFENAGLDIELVEQPVHADRLDELAFVTANVDTPIMADESVRTLADLEAIVALSAAALVNIKLAKTGGLRPAQRMVAVASDAGIGVFVGCMMESSVGIGAAAALAASIGVDRPQDLDGGLWLRSSPVHGGARYVGDRIEPADAPGLGITSLAAPRAE